MAETSDARPLLEIARAADRRDLEGDVLLGLARLERDSGNLQVAFGHAQEAERVLAGIGADADAADARTLLSELAV